MEQSRKATWGWALYDWANSAFATTIMAGFFPIFFKHYWNSGVDANISTARLGFGNAVASLLLALMAPLIGAIADYNDSRKRFLLFFAYLGVMSTACLFFIPSGEWLLAVIMYVVAVMGFSGANIFYDSLLPFVAPKDKRDYVSGLGYALGYLGGGLLFLLNVLMVTKPSWFALKSETLAVRYSFLSVAIWWGVFSIFPAIWVPEPTTTGRRLNPSNRFHGIFSGVSEVITTVKKIAKSRNILLFLTAYWLYIEGVDTIVRMAVDYGMSIGFDSKILISALLITQFVGFPATIGFTGLSRYLGTKNSIFAAIAIYVLITLWGIFMRKSFEFYILAILIGLVQGGIQALSRSYYSRLIPEEKSGEYFGFYNMLGKFAAIVGPALVAVSVLVARKLLVIARVHEGNISNITEIASRCGIASLLILFGAGAALLIFVKDHE